VILLRKQELIRMNYTMLEEARELAGWQAETEVLAVYTALLQVKDKRGKQGKRYALALVLTYILLAKAAGETTLQAITEWIRLRAAFLQAVFPGAGRTFPCAAPSSNALRAVEPEAVNAVLMALLTRVRASTREPGEQEHVALDGKTLRGTQKHEAADQQKLHHVTVYETRTGTVVKEQAVADKESEQTRVEQVLQPVCVKGRVLTADALHTHAKVCAHILASPLVKKRCGAPSSISMGSRVMRSPFVRCRA
jgi:hypothetical protein